MSGQRVGVRHPLEPFGSLRGARYVPGAIGRQRRQRRQGAGDGLLRRIEVTRLRPRERERPEDVSTPPAVTTSGRYAVLRLEASRARGTHRACGCRPPWALVARAATSSGASPAVAASCRPARSGIGQQDRCRGCAERHDDPPRGCPSVRRRDRPRGPPRSPRAGGVRGSPDGPSLATLTPCTRRVRRAHRTPPEFAAMR